MLTRTGTSWVRGAGRAFSLVELLLSIALLLLLLSALVFNFGGMQRGAGLQEGELQVEGLLRFARGYSASSGRLVQIQLTNSISEGTNLVFSLVSETDPIHNPGCFELVFEAAQYLEQITKLVNVTDVRLLDSSMVMVDATSVTNDLVQAASTGVWPSISFYPDGTSDSAGITIVSRDEEDARKILVRLAGEIGAVSHGYVSETVAIGGRTDSILRGLP